MFQDGKFGVGKFKFFAEGLATKLPTLRLTETLSHLNFRRIPAQFPRNFRGEIMTI